MNEKEKRSRIELLAKFDEQIHFLETSANQFDLGDDAEAIRMAVCLRILLHDTKRNRSLLSQLNKKNTKFLDSAFEDKSNIPVPYSGLVSVHMTKGKVRYVASLDDIPRVKLVDFDKWWNSIIFKDAVRQQISRKELVVTMADQDGGAHVDSSLDKKYSQLIKGSLLFQKYSIDGKIWFNMKNIERVAMRQISHEVLKTLKSGYTKKQNLKENGVLIGGISLVAGSRSIAVEKIRKIGRNDPCPCGSGKKYKKCCGKE
jgi:hypothetical protein